MTQRPVPGFGLLLALLALVAQLSLGAVVPRPEFESVFDEVGVICRAAAVSDGTTPAPHRHRHHMPACQFCPWCTSLATPHSILPGAAPRLVPPQVATFFRPDLLPPNAPPVAAILSPRPRGPPVLA